MSARRDKNQRHTFVYSNLYSLYKKRQEKLKDETLSAPTMEWSKSRSVLKVKETAAPQSEVKVSAYQPKNLGAPSPSLETDIFFKKESQELAESEQAVESLKRNLNELNQVHQRLQHMLKELEEMLEPESK